MRLRCPLQTPFLFLFLTLCFRKSLRAQYFQDETVNVLVFENRTSGYFLEAGAGDGDFHSNTYFYEKYLGWKGICIEPLPHHFENVQRVRSCMAFNGALCDREGPRSFIDFTTLKGHSGFYDTFPTEKQRNVNNAVYPFKNITVQCYTLDQVVKQAGFPRLDYMIIDTEGYEYDLIKTFNLNNPSFPINVVQVELNRNPSELRELFRKSNFLDPVRIDEHHPDDIYISKRLMSETELQRRISTATVACSERCRRPVTCAAHQQATDKVECSTTQWTSIL